MSRVEAIEKKIESLSPEELAALREWFLEFDSAVWDRQIESDARAGRLDKLIAEANREYKRGKTTDL